MIYEKQTIEDVYLVKPQVFEDSRGYTFESYRKRELNEVTKKDIDFVQYNLSKSSKNVLRGLHYQSPKMPQGKLVQAVEGKILDVAVDVRKSSPTFGKWISATLSEDNKNMLWIPEGLAHGFYVLSNTAKIYYFLTNYYSPPDERCIMWNDDFLNINWSLNDKPLISEKDKEGKKFKDLEYFD